MEEVLSDGSLFIDFLELRKKPRCDMSGTSQEHRATQNIEQPAHATDAPFEQAYIQHACIHPIA